MTITIEAINIIEQMRKENYSNDDILNAFAVAFGTPEAVDRNPEFGDSAIHKLARYGYTELLEIILTHKEFQNSPKSLLIPNKIQQTILHAAVDSGKLETVKLIVEHPLARGLNLEYRYSGQLPISIGGKGMEIPFVTAVEKNHIDIVEYFINDREIHDPFLLQACLRIAEGKYEERVSNDELIIYLACNGAIPSVDFITRILAEDSSASSDLKGFFASNRESWEERPLHIVSPTWHNSSAIITYEESDFNLCYQSDLRINRLKTVQALHGFIQGISPVGDSPEGIMVVGEYEDISDLESSYSDSDEEMIDYETDLENDVTRPLIHPGEYSFEDF